MLVSGAACPPDEFLPISFPVRLDFTQKAPKIYITGVRQTNAWPESKLALKQRCVVLLTVFEQLVVATATVSGNLPSTASFKEKKAPKQRQRRPGLPIVHLPQVIHSHLEQNCVLECPFLPLCLLSMFIKSVCFPQCCSKWKKQQQIK